MDQPQQNDNYFDGVYIGPPVPRSVFYRGRKKVCIAFYKTSDIAIRRERERRKQDKQLARKRKAA